MRIHGQKMGLVGACLMAAAVATAGDWPQFTGPNGDNTTITPPLADAWPTGGPTLVWTTNVEGAVNGKTFRDVPGWFASPVVAGGRVFVIGRRYELSNDPASKQFQSTPDVLRCMNAADGKQLWQRDIPVRGAINPRHRQGEYFRSCWITPTVDGDRLYVRGSNGEVFCLNVKDGSVVWHWPEADADAAKLDQQGYWVAAPGVIAAGLFICNEIGGGNSRMIALDKLTGALRWRGKDTPDWGWSASGIVPMTLGGRTVLLTSDIAVDAKTGEDLIQRIAPDGKPRRTWEPGKIEWVSVAHGNRLLTGLTREVQVTGAAGDTKKEQRNGVMLAEFSFGTNGLLVVRSVWEHMEQGAAGGGNAKAYGGPVLAGDYAYVFVGQNTENSLLCLRLSDGAEQWRAKLKHVLGYANVAAADGKIYYQWNGQLSMVALEPKGYRELDSAKVAGEGMSSVAIAGTRLYMRDDAGKVLCLELGK